MEGYGPSIALDALMKCCANLSAEGQMVRPKPASSDTVDGEASSEHSLLVEFFILAGDRPGIAEESAGILLARFGSLGAILDRTSEDLSRCSVSANQSRALRIATSVVESILKRRIEDRPCFPDVSSVTDYLHWKTANLRREQVGALYLTNHLHLITYDVVSVGSVAHANFSSRALISRALEVNAVNIILTHNHPSGHAEPSREDIQLTFHVHELCRSLEVKLLDHIIISKSGSFSFLSQGSMPGSKRQ